MTPRHMTAFTVTYCRKGEDGTRHQTEASISFSYDSHDYGNGHYMYIASPDEPWGGQLYDIRYDTEFHRDEMLTYIVQFFAKRYSGKDGAWKLIEIAIAKD